MLKRIALLAVAVLAFFGGPLGMGRALAGQTAADLTAMTNADRAAARLRALSTASDLQSLAQQRAQEQAKAGRIYHTQNLGSKLSGWKRLGENVGRGPDLRDIEVAFMNSPSHRENILDPGFTQVGVGVVYDGREYYYVAVLFREPMGTVASPPPTTTPTTRAAQAPKPKPTTTTQAPKPTTTTQAPTTTTQAPTTTTTAPPPPPPVEEIVAPPVIETTTTTAARPIYTDRDFLAENFNDPILPVVATSPVPAPGRSVTPIVLAAVMAAAVGLGVGRAWGNTANRNS